MHLVSELENMNINAFSFGRGEQKLHLVSELENININAFSFGTGELK